MVDHMAEQFIDINDPNLSEEKIAEFTEPLLQVEFMGKCVERVVKVLGSLDKESQDRVIRSVVVILGLDQDSDEDDK